MTGKELFEKLLPNLLRIGPEEKNLQLYQEIKETLNDFLIIDSFHQLKKNNQGDGLAFEVMLYDKNLIHDIVITRTTIEFITILIGSVNMTDIETDYKVNKNEKGEISVIDNLEFTISYGGGLRTLVYITDTKRFTEMNRIRTNLLKIITQ